MFSDALQRNAKHGARLSNISDDWSGERVATRDLICFASLGMTSCTKCDEEVIGQRDSLFATIDD
jgi:hypothetical protein